MLKPRCRDEIIELAVEKYNRREASPSKGSGDVATMPPVGRASSPIDSPEQQRPFPGEERSAFREASENDLSYRASCFHGRHPSFRNFLYRMELHFGGGGGGRCCTITLAAGLPSGSS